MKLGLIFGGRSGEHEVSLISAASVLRNIDKNKFEIIPISIDKEGIWRMHKLSQLPTKGALEINKNDPIITLATGSAGKARIVGNNKELETIDLAFPVMHGPFCEDGSLQGLLEMCNIPYVGSRVTASALGMDKDFAKRIFQLADIPVTPFEVIYKSEWSRNKATIVKKLEQRFKELPVFVKPANMGSSVGVHKVKNWKSLTAAMDDAFRFDLKILVEQGIPAREIELSVIEELSWDKDPFVSVAGEVIPSAKHEFYSYESKYLDANGAEFEIPAELSSTQLRNLQEYSRKAFKALGCAGFARVDFLVHQESGKIYLNEINTIPGFTSISMFPKMLEASGMPYPEILSRLCDLAMRDFKARAELLTDFNKSN